MRKFIINSRKVRTNAVNAVKTITGEENLEVIIQEHKENKTQEQRSFWHVLLKIISDDTGYTPSEVKELVKKRVLGTKVVSIGGYTKEVTESSEEQDKGSYSNLIESTYQIAAEAGIVLPNPLYRE